MVSPRRVEPPVTARVLEAAGAAAEGFIGLLVVGAVLILAGKLQFPDLGSGAAPGRVLSAIAIAALASLGAPVRLGGVSLQVLPLGAVVAVGVVLALAMRRRTGTDLRNGDAARQGLLLGACFGVLCAAAAAVFRIPGATPVSVSVVRALVAGAILGFVSGALGTAATRRWKWIGSRENFLGRVGLAALGWAAASASLLWVVVRLARGPLPERFGIADAVAATIYLIAFLPNVLVGITTLGMGATVTVGSQISGGGRVSGELREYSLLDWGGGAAPAEAWLLVLIPALAFGAAGWLAARADPTPPRPGELAMSLFTVGVAIALLAAVADASLGAGLVRQSGVAEVSIDAAKAGVAAVLWGAVAGTAGWVTARRMHPDTTILEALDARQDGRHLDLVELLADRLQVDLADGGDRRFEHLAG